MSKVAESIDRLGDLFNGDSIDRLMDHFAEDAVFQSAQGEIHRGKAAIKGAFSPLFDGTLGKVHFDWTESVVDEPAGKAVVCWTLSMTRNGSATKVRGLDVFAFEGGLVKAKNTYGKATALLVE